MSNRELWHFITGRSLTEAKEQIKAEIDKYEERLKKALAYYKPSRTNPGESLSKDKKLDDSTSAFVKKLSQFLHLDEAQSFELYETFKSQEFRGTAADLQNSLAADHQTEMLLFKIRDYYYNERLYLLRSIKHLLSYWSDDSHPYNKQYKAFVLKLYKTQDFIECLQQQYDTACESTPPSWEACGKNMSKRHEQIWVIQNLKEQCELLDLMLLYYHGGDLMPGTLLNLANKFKRQGFGRRQTNRHLLGEHAEVLLHRIGFLQIIILLEGLEFDDLFTRCKTNSVENHNIIKAKERESLEQLIENLGQAIEHGPLLLAWAVIRELGTKGDELKTAALGNKALSVKVFPYLVSRLKTDPFSGQSVTANTCHTVIYSLMCCVLEAFHQDTLGDQEGLKDLAAVLLKKPAVAEDFWRMGMDTGLGTLFQVACYYFPLDLCHLVELCVSLAEAGPVNAQRVVKILQNMNIYTELMCNAPEVKATKQTNIWQLVKNRRPYNVSHQIGSHLIIPSGTLGEYQQLGSVGIVHWDCVYNVWDVFICELLVILEQVAHGQGTVQMESIERVASICQLMHKLLSNCESFVLKSVVQLQELMVLVYQVIERFCQIHPPPLNLLAACVDCVHQVALQEPVMGWRKLQQTGLLPHLTGNIDNLAELYSGSDLNVGAYGAILAGVECTHGQYTLTVSLLDLVSDVIQPLSQCGEVDVLLGSVMYITREVFPMFRKWRYSCLSQRGIIGNRCLEIFHRLLNVMNRQKVTNDKVSVREACIYSLLYAEAGYSLLDIAATSVETVNAALASQGSATEGAGVDLIQMLRMAFSVLNRLLILRPDGAHQSPVEHSLSAHGTGVGGKRNVMASVAQYIYHRHDSRLPALAVVLLKRLAMIFPMSILASLGDEAEPIRDVFLSRLQAETEAIHLKVVILEFLSACVSTQPGLIEIFVNVKPTNVKPATGKSQQQAEGKPNEKDVVIEDLSCLPTVLSLIDSKKQGTYACPSQVLCAAIEFIHALWLGQRETAMVALRQMQDFWYSICLSLTRDLQSPEDTEADVTVLEKEMKSCANVMKILGLELYNNQSLDDNVKTVIGDILNKGRLLYWSEYICKSLQWSSRCENECTPSEWSENSALQLLYAWRNFILVLSNVGLKIKQFHIPDAAKERILQHILTGIQYQFNSDHEVTVLNVKLASVSSAFYITLLRRWVSSMKCLESAINQLVLILASITACTESPLPSVHIGLLGALSLMLQHVRQTKSSSLDENCLASLVPKVCGLIQQSTYQLHPTQQSAANTTSKNTTLRVQQAADTQQGTSMLSSTTMRMDSSYLDNSLSKSDRSVVSQIPKSTSAGEPSPDDGNSELQKETEVKLKLLTSALCLLDELVLSLPSPSYWLPEVREYTLLETLLESLERWTTVNHGVEYIHTVFMLLLTLAKHPQSAESLAGASFIQQLCLIISHLYSQPELPNKHNSVNHKTSSKVSWRIQPTWSSIYCLSISLFTSLLHTLKYNFVKYAIEFIGVHQDKMHQCLSSANVLLRVDLLEEATQTCRFLSELSHYRRQWGLHLPEVLQKLMMDVCMMMQSCVSLLIRPTLLQHMLETCILISRRPIHHSQKQRNGQDMARIVLQDKYVSAPFIRSMSQQPDDSDNTTREVMIVQNALLSIVCHCLVALRRFSPDLCEIILDQNVDVSEYEGFLQIGFSTPPIERDSPLTFGTLVSCISLCLFLLNKVDPRGPLGTPTKQDGEKSPIERSLIMFVLENTLYLTMSQALRCLRDPRLHSRDKQLIKRELGAELSSFLSGMQRYLRRGSGPHTPGVQQMVTPQMLTEASYLKLVHSFIKKVLR